MAGYSGTPLARKLGIRPGASVAVVDAPAGWAIPELPDGVVVEAELAGAHDVVLAFLRERKLLVERLPALREAIHREGSLWIAWPRRAGGHVSDITENRLREDILPCGLVDTKVAALDEDWSGLRFVWRRRLRASR
ncbi:MAG TPA: DUF3052 family protein [Candidatus Dormibacteraeota bacterium]|jgi:hypothetical protein